MDKKSYRLKITDGQYVTYLTRDEKGRVSYFNGSETSLALSNLVGTRAAELRFMLEDAMNSAAAHLSLLFVLKEMWKNNPSGMPKVESIVPGVKKK